MANKPTRAEITAAKQLLTRAGYSVRYPWHVEDVLNRCECSEDEAHEILDYVLTNDGIMTTINEAIDDAIAEAKYPLRK